MKILHLAAAFSFFALTACCSSGKTTNEGTKSDAMETKQMIASGFTMGTIIGSTAENDCAYVISSEIDGNAVMYDPTNLEKDYMKDGMKVWYKFRPLRMMNRCEKANPVEVTEMKRM